ncbi:MAG: GNAT family N-acetyltransferase [Myxococcales bacterium]|nr:GNAT family N-acetyltransferase [Myxococcales bacterium]
MTSVSQILGRERRNDVVVRPAQGGDADGIWENIERCWDEGRESWESEHMPIGVSEMEANARALAANLARSVALPGWQRYWVLDHHGSIVGHADLTGGRFRSELHVARFGIAIRRAHWHRGHGHRLMEEAITWAWSRPEIHRIELTVFAQNRRAQALYRRLGFVEEGRARRRFRLQDHWVDDISMALLRPESAEAPTQPKNP